MIKLKHIKLLFSSMLVMLLTACGGGGGGGSSSDASDDTENTTQSMVEVPVNNTVVYEQGIKKTGQTKSYNVDGTEDLDGVVKDDGHYETGVNISYSRANEIVTDNITRLMWQDNQEVTSVKKEWDSASTYCQELVLGGHQDWRLPKIKELQSIVSLSKTFPSIDSTFKKIAQTTNIYWSSTPSTKVDNSAWSVRFNYGYTMHLDKDNKYFVRCVREK